MICKKLDRHFFTQPALAVARDILGKFLVREYRGKKIAGKIVEVEVYAGTDDRASHAFGGKKTQHNLAEYLIGGHVYIYLVYGMYWQFNISTGLVDEPECILIRALEPVEGVDLMLSSRSASGRRSDLKAMGLLRPHQLAGARNDVANLANGPGKLCQALKLDKSFYGYDLGQGDGQLCVEDRGVKLESSQIARGPRIGIDYAGSHWSQIPWRFWIKDNAFVSK